MKQYDISTFSLPEGEALLESLGFQKESIRATEEPNESMLTPLERHLWNQFLNGTEGAGNGNE